MGQMLFILGTEDMVGTRQTNVCSQGILTLMGEIGSKPINERIFEQNRVMLPIPPTNTYCVPMAC